MKRTITFIILILFFLNICLMFNGYKNGYNEPQIIEGISMVIKDGTLTNKSATIIITDRREDEEHTYGDSFRIEKKVDNKWFNLDTKIKNYGFNSIGYSVDENRKLQLNVNWEWLYGELESGEYRLIKDFAISKNDTYVGNKEIYVIFEID